MPRTHRRPPKAHGRDHRASGSGAPMVMSEEQKHELILAHASSREGRKQDWGVGYSIAVAASFLVVVSGWFLTWNRGHLTGTVRAPDPFIQTLRDTGERIKNEGAPQAAEVVHAIQQAADAVTSTPPTPNNN